MANVIFQKQTTLGVHPGDYVARYLQYTGQTCHELALTMAVSNDTIVELCHGEIELTPGLITQLAQATHTDRQLWWDLDRQYQMAKSQITVS